MMHYYNKAGIVGRSGVPPLVALIMNPPRKRRRGEAKLTGDKLIDTMDAVISSLGSMELAILQLFNHYDIDLDDLCCLLLGLFHESIFGMRLILVDKGLNVSLSKVKY
jgi:hypothetical protein